MRSIVRLRCGAGRYETVRRTRVTVGYLKTRESKMLASLSSSTRLNQREGREGRREGERGPPCMVDFTGLELDLNDLAALEE